MSRFGPWGLVGLGAVDGFWVRDSGGEEKKGSGKEYMNQKKRKKNHRAKE